MDLKKQGHCYSKREEARLPLLFLNNNDPVFCNLLFSGPYFGRDFFSGSQTDPCFQNKNSGCRLAERLSWSATYVATLMCRLEPEELVMKVLFENWKWNYRIISFQPPFNFLCAYGASTLLFYMQLDLRAHRLNTAHCTTYRNFMCVAKTLWVSNSVNRIRMK